MVLLFGLLVATTGVLFVSIPRVHLEQAIPFLSLPQQGLSGFSDVVRLGDVTSIQEDDSVALRVDVPGIEAIPGDPYWRMLILDRYAAGAFVNSLFLSDSSEREPPRVHDISPFPARWFSGENRSAGAWTFYLERNVSRYLPILGPFREMTFQGDQRLEANPDVLVFRIPNTNSSVFSYRVRDFLVEGETPASRIDQPLIRGNSPQGEGEDERYPFTTLEVSVEPEEEEFLKELVAKILDGSEVSAQEEGEKILNYLRANHTYTLSPGSFAEGDPIVQWLREGRPGHCEFFAGAFTLLARTAGIPARMVVGFSGGSWNSFENFFVVRNRNAHAWSEILVGESWVRFDPTPGGGSGSSGAAATTGGVQFARDSDFRAWVDSLRIMWYRRVINFDDDSQQEMIEGVSGFAQSVWNQVKESLLDGWEGLKSFGRSVLDSALQTVGVVVGVLLVLSLAWIPFRRLGLRWRIFGKIGKLHPIRRRAGIELRRLEDSGIRTDGGEEQFERLRANLLEVRFGRVLELTEATRLFREVRRFRRGKSG